MGFSMPGLEKSDEGNAYLWHKTRSHKNVPTHNRTKKAF